MAYSPGKTPLSDETGEASAQRVALRLQQIKGGPAGYRLRRIILTNFWLYEYQVFEIPHGRLFLAGDNGSGKSTVLTAAITLALDGDHRPERIDTFGKREKKIDYYILGGESNTPFYHDQRTSYIGLEFEWCAIDEPPFASELRALWEKGEREKARFLTIGVGFAGNKNNVKPITDSCFLITDGSRLEQDISTLISVAGEQNPRACDLKTFKKRVGEHGYVYDRQSEYAQKVAQCLFNFSKVDDLTRLTKQLLYLRQPNLNSVLSLEKVRSYLDESLPELPTTLIEHAADMLDKMEELKATTAARKMAYTAAEKLHRAQQATALASARLCACESLHTYVLLENKRKEVQRTERNIKKGERDLSHFRAQVATLETEEQQLRGQISALENSEGMQLAQRLSDTSIRAQEARETLAASQQALRAAIERREQRAQECEEIGEAFQKKQRESVQLLHDMQSGAQKEAHWSIASEQLQATLERVRDLTLDVSQLDVPATPSSLSDYTINEQLAWLERLKGLHGEIKRVVDSLQVSQQREQLTYATMDEVTRAFESKRTEICARQQEVVDRFEGLLEETRWIAVLPASDQAVQIWNASLLPAESVPELLAIGRRYREAIKQVQEDIQREQDELEIRLQHAYGERGGRLKERERLQEVYRQKLLEPEFVPARPAHRQQARRYLAEEGIQALPLYMLIDFTEEVDSQSPLAGGIEQALADAGLLDALVVLPEETAAMDACCKAHGLTDCRLDWQRLDNKRSEDLFSFPLMRLLRVDPALSESIGQHGVAWSETAQRLLAQLQMGSSNDGNNWSHGLLTGIVGGGEVRSIGKANRVRAREQELARLREQETLVIQELERVEATIEQLGREKQALIKLYRELTVLLSSAGMADVDATLHSALENLERAQREYHLAQDASRGLRQQAQTLRVQMEKEVGRTTIFASGVDNVEKAREMVQQLKNNRTLLVTYLTALRESWQRYRRIQPQLVQDAAQERAALLVQQRDEKSLTRVEAELAELEQVAQAQTGTDLVTLQQRLTAWKQRQEALPKELQDARTDQTRTETTLGAHQNEYTTLAAELSLFEGQYEGSLNVFLASLTLYQVEVFAEIQQQIAGSMMRPEVVFQLFEQKLEVRNDTYTALKEKLEKDRSRTENALFIAFTEVHGDLHQYGPHIDDAGIARFSNAEESNTYELLARLSDEIQVQEQLLETKEYELFQNFLLKEMANTVGTRLTDAELWVERMNALLADSPFMGKRYRLRWVIRPFDAQRPGSRLALYRDVLRRQAETFNQEEVEKLVDAFKQEINDQRAQQTSTETFTEALVSILDYRHWFQFEIDMLHEDGKTQHLTNKFFRTGSGAEQYIALYIPFFTALSALYERAGKGAPRLIALDEAFEKVSVVNTRKLLNFLARQNFQWIMTGPRVTGEGTELPACVKYTMFCRKSEELAAGFPSFWSNNPVISKEVRDG